MVWLCLVTFEKQDMKLVDSASDAEGVEVASSESDASDAGVDVEPVRIYL